MSLYVQDGRPGRRPLSPEHLREVLDVAFDAWAERRPVSHVIAERWNVTPNTARQWLYKANRRVSS